MTEDPAPVPDAVLQQAEQLMRCRFRHAGELQPPLDTLYELGVERTAGELQADPMLHTRQRAHLEAMNPPAAPGESLDPLEMLRSDIKLPSLPQFFAELQTAIDSQTASAADIAQIISRDPSLATFLLRMVNSAFYNFPQQIDTVTRAVTVIGVRQISTLALGTSVMTAFRDIPPEILDMGQFWKHCIATGIIAKEISLLTGRSDPERCFVAGLLHDIGRLVIFRLEPERGAAMLARSLRKRQVMYEAERDELGFDHSRIGGMLLRKWNLPFSLVSTVLDHHQPRQEQALEAPGIVHVADTVAMGLGIGSSGEYFIPAPTMLAWHGLGIEAEHLRRIRDALDARLGEAFGVLMAA